MDTATQTCAKKHHYATQGDAKLDYQRRRRSFRHFVSVKQCRCGGYVLRGPRRRRA